MIACFLFSCVWLAPSVGSGSLPPTASTSLYGLTGLEPLDERPTHIPDRIKRRVRYLVKRHGQGSVFSKGDNWRWLVAQGAAESGYRRFKDKTRVLESHAGALGDFQIMPSTGRQFGFSEKDLANPVKNCLAAIRLHVFNERVVMSKKRLLHPAPGPPEEPDFHLIFILLGGYNAGIGWFSYQEVRGITCVSGILVRSGHTEMHAKDVIFALPLVTESHSKETISYWRRIFLNYNQNSPTSHFTY